MRQRRRRRFGNRPKQTVENHPFMQMLKKFGVLGRRPEGRDSALAPMITKTRRIAGTSDFKVIRRG